MKKGFICLTIMAFSLALAIPDRSFGQAGNESKSQPSKQKKAQQASTEKDVVIGHLQSRDKTITISKGKKGTVYTVKDKDGKILNADLSEKDFQSKYPTLYEQVKYGLAGNDATLRRTTQVPVAPQDARDVHLDAKPAK